VFYLSKKLDFNLVFDLKKQTKKNIYHTHLIEIIDDIRQQKNSSKTQGKKNTQVEFSFIKWNLLTQKLTFFMAIISVGLDFLSLLLESNLSLFSQIRD
jgi:histone deacetylase complex regulatory component SIN3